MSREELRGKFNYPNWLLDIYKKAFGSEYELALKSLKKPTWRYYLRINTYRIDVNKVLEMLESEGIKAKQDEKISEAIYIEGYVEQNPTLLPSYVVAKIDAAESCSEGADLYRPGVISINNADKESKVSIVTPDLEVAAEGIMKMNREEFKNTKKGLVVKNIKPKFKRPNIQELEVFKRGLVYAQSYPSILTIKELDPKKGETIIDMCASPGGKLSHIIELTKNEANIIACDKSYNKIHKIEENLLRLQLPIPKLIKTDSRFLDIEIGREIADKIILDPSCSDLGLRPRITFNIPKKDVISYSNYQKQFLRAAYNLLKKGGILCYSVCTISYEETIENFEYAVKELGFEELSLDFLGVNKSIFIFKPHIQDTPGYAIFKVRKPN